MVVAREQDRPAPAKRARSGKRVLVRSGAGVGFKAGDDVTEVSVSKTRFERIAGKPQTLGKVLSGYADTLAKAKRTGRSVTVTFRVSPDGEAESVLGAPEDDPLDRALAAARARGQIKVADILKGEDMLTARAFGPLIGASHETINAKRKRGEVLGLEGAIRGVKYPRWQVTEAGLPLPGLPALFKALGEQPWTVYRFLRAGHAELGGRTALEALKAGQIDAVLGVARNQGGGVFA
jgi:ABC-type amino acid transport substrate-binding protein